jgi:hypothetical protein
MPNARTPEGFIKVFYLNGLYVGTMAGDIPKSTYFSQIYGK